MMENNNKSQASMLAGLGGITPMQPNLQTLSPYLNVDTNYLQSSPQYLEFDQDTRRGEMEKSFSAIGSACCIGSGLGGAYGLDDGIRQTANSELSAKLRRTQIMNYCLKGGASTGNALASVAVIYSLSNWLLTKTEVVEDDEAKSLISGTFTGALFKSTTGIKKCVRGAGVGLALSAFWAFGIKKQDSVQNFI
jgi:import inner membrane translocase subunit TIM23